MEWTPGPVRSRPGRRFKVNDQYGGASAPAPKKVTVPDLVAMKREGRRITMMTAYDAASGAVKWSWTGDGPGYGSPMVIDVDGARQIVTITQTKIVGVDAANGALLWERPFVAKNTTNSITPV